MSENLLDLIPSFKRQLRRYIREEDTDSQLAGYLADAVDALNWRWNRSYVITVTPPNTYYVEPNVTARDKRPIILMASIIYKISSTDLASFRDGDFAYDPVHLRITPYTQDVEELKDILPSYPMLQSGFTSPLRGFSNVWNPESYVFLWNLLI